MYAGPRPTPLADITRPRFIAIPPYVSPHRLATPLKCAASHAIHGLAPMTAMSTLHARIVGEHTMDYRIGLRRRSLPIVCNELQSRCEINAYPDVARTTEAFMTI